MESNAFLYVSLISLGTLIVSGGLSYINFQKIAYTKIIWNIMSSNFYGINLITIEMVEVTLYIIFTILLFFTLFSFILIILYRNDLELREGILGNLSKFHFIPILCGTALYIIGLTYTNKTLNNDLSLIFSIIFSGIGLGSLIFIYIKTNISKCFSRLIIKKGLYSCLIALFVYNLCFSSTFLGIKKATKNYPLKYLDWMKGFYIALSLVIGIFNLIISFFLKDLLISGMNIIIYVGMIIYFFKIEKKVRTEINGLAEGIIEIVIGVLSIAMICFLIIRYKTDIFK